MKTKKYLPLILISFTLIIILNITILNYYKKFVTNTLNSVASSLIASYPEAEDQIMDIIIYGDKNLNVFKKYNINNETIHNVSNYSNLTFKILFITNLIYFSIIFMFFLSYFLYNKKIKKEIRLINNYLTKIIKGTYDLDIADYNEDDLSVLKNDIYKVTIKLKEYSSYEHREKLFLMNTLEDISHQLKTPLTALMLTNDILKSRDLTESEYQEFLTKETKELERMEWLITTLLKISKLDSGTITLKKETIKASDLITKSLSSLNISLELKNIKLITNNLDFDLTCDINWTTEALTNIIKNAIEHLQDSGIITIIGETNPLYKALIIKDNGLGIKKSDLKNIFERFYSTNNSKNSFGIGLNMAKLIIEQQNGKIEVKSQKGDTEFKIIFNKNNY